MFWLPQALPSGKNRELQKMLFSPWHTPLPLPVQRPWPTGFRAVLSSRAPLQGCQDPTDTEQSLG